MAAAKFMMQQQNAKHDTSRRVQSTADAKQGMLKMRALSNTQQCAKTLSLLGHNSAIQSSIQV
jgi:hypothetical protein